MDARTAKNNRFSERLAFMRMHNAYNDAQYVECVRAMWPTNKLNAFATENTQGNASHYF